MLLSPELRRQRLPEVNWQSVRDCFKGGCAWRGCTRTYMNTHIHAQYILVMPTFYYLNYTTLGQVTFTWATESYKCGTNVRTLKCFKLISIWLRNRRRATRVSRIRQRKHLASIMTDYRNTEPRCVLCAPPPPHTILFSISLHYRLKLAIAQWLILHRAVQDC